MRKERKIICLAFVATLLGIWLLVLGAAMAGENQSPYEPSTVCASCHADIHGMWVNGMHAQAYADPIFRASFLQAFFETKGEAAGYCLRCHDPTSRIPENLDVKRDIVGAGVTCDFCHTVQDIDLGRRDAPLNSQPGVRKTGPYINSHSPAHDTEKKDFFKKSELCAGCHQLKGQNGVVLIGTYQEWKESSYAADDVQCQDCHMPVEPEKKIVSEDVKRSKRKVNLHNLAGGHSIDQIRSAIKVEIKRVVQEDDSLFVTVHVTNVNSGHKIPTGKYRGYGPNMGLRGFCLSLDGDIYIIRSNNYQYGGIWDNNGVEGTVDVFGPDGRPKQRGLVDGLGHGDCGLGVDALGNVYVGINIKPEEAPLPAYFRDQVPAEGWVWWRRATREAPWCYPYYSAYLFHMGSAVKFGPEGGKLYGFGGQPSARKGQPQPKPSPLISVDNAPASALTYRSGYLQREVKVVGAHWRYDGIGIIPTSDLNWGDPCCVCLTSRLVADPYGRVFAANCFRFGIEVLDTAGNHIMRIGRYGNVDSAGPGSLVPEPEIAFAWPAFVSVADGKLYVSDPVNRRVTVVRFDHARIVQCDVP